MLPVALGGVGVLQLLEVWGPPPCESSRERVGAAMVVLYAGQAGLCRDSSGGCHG